MSELVTPAAIIINVLNDVKERFPDVAAKTMRELVEHNEPGVALHILCSQILEFGIELPAHKKSQLITAACFMDIPLSDLDGLDERVGGQSPEDRGLSPRSPEIALASPVFDSPPTAHNLQLAGKPKKFERRKHAADRNGH